MPPERKLNGRKWLVIRQRISFTVHLPKFHFQKIGERVERAKRAALFRRDRFQKNEPSGVALALDTFESQQVKVGRTRGRFPFHAARIAYRYHQRVTTLVFKRDRSWETCHV